MLAVTLSLGVWQIQRLHWKQGLLAEIDRAEAAPPIPLPVEPVPFEKVQVSGTIGAASARYGTEVRSTAAGPELGSQVIVPLRRSNGDTVLVDLGWLPDSAAPPRPGGDVTLTGYVRPAEPASWLAPSPDLARRRFWSLDPAVIGPALGLSAVAPYTLVVLGPETASPSPAQTLPRPPNDHLGYAITWFGLAACLLVVFFLFIRSSKRHDRV